MIDYGTRQTDLAVRRAEWRLSRVYRQAQRDIDEKLKDWQKRHEEREAKYRQQLADGKITQADFDAWMRGQVFQDKQWQARKAEIDRILLNADREAQRIVNEGKIGVFADNANYIGYDLERNGNVNTGFTLYDQNTVGRLIKSDPQILPKPAPGVQKDKAYTYYNKLMNSAITQGIVQGETIQQIAKRIVNTTGERSYASAVRNARTAYTGAQNAGRMEGLHQAQALGIKVKKQWMATLDDRTRDTHAELDGQIRDVDEPFEVDGMEIDYPGDPTADPSLVYNCRCTLVYIYPDYPSEMQRRDNETGEIVGDMTYREWEAMKQGEAEQQLTPTFEEWYDATKNTIMVPTAEEWADIQEKAKFAADAQSRRDMGETLNYFGVENPIISKRDITDFYQYAQQTNGITTVRDNDGNVIDHLTKQAEQAMDGLLDKLTDRMNVVDAQADEDFRDIKRWLRETPLYISQQDRANIPDFEDYRKSKQNFVRVSNDPSVISLDSIYQDLVQSYPGRFNPEITDVSDMMQEINNGLEALDRSRSTPIKDTISAADYAEMRDMMRTYLLAGFEAAKQR